MITMAERVGQAGRHGAGGIIAENLVTSDPQA